MFLDGMFEEAFELLSGSNQTRKFYRVAMRRVADGYADRVEVTTVFI